MQRMNTGFTLVEMLVTLMDMIILVAYAVPMYTNTITMTRMTSEINSLLRGLNVARSEAIKRGLPISFCPVLPSPTTATTACSTTTTWSSGWVILDTTTPALIQISNGVTHGDTLTSTQDSYPTFNQSGYTFFTGTLSLHDVNNTQSLYQCLVFSTGSWTTQTGASCP